MGERESRHSRGRVHRGPDGSSGDAHGTRGCYYQRIVRHRRRKDPGIRGQWNSGRQAPSRHLHPGWRGAGTLSRRADHATACVPGCDRVRPGSPHWVNAAGAGAVSTCGISASNPQAPPRRTVQTEPAAPPNRPVLPSSGPRCLGVPVRPHVSRLDPDHRSAPMSVTRVVAGWRSVPRRRIARPPGGPPRPVRRRRAAGSDPLPVSETGPGEMTDDFTRATWVDVGIAATLGESVPGAAARASVRRHGTNRTVRRVHDLISSRSFLESNIQFEA